MSIKQRFSSEPLYLMDGSAFVFRGFYANQSMQRSDGFPTSALFIVTRILLKILREEQPTHFAFILDGHGPNFRHELFPLYKAQRKATPEELVRQIEPIQRLIHALGLKLIVSSGCEADDCLASVAKRFRGERPVVLVALDKDLKQCLHPNVLMWDPASKDEKIVTLTSFRNETGLTPEQWPDIQAIIGDSSDNIPGIRGVGPKTAEKLFQDFPTLEAIRDGFDTLPPTLKKKFDGQLDAMFLYRKLTTLNTEQCADITLDDLRVRPINRKEAATLLREFELNSLERELAGMVRNGLVHTEDEAAGAARDNVTGKATPVPTLLSLLDTPAVTPRRTISRPELLPSFAGAAVSILDDENGSAMAVGQEELLYIGPLSPLVEHLCTAAMVVTPDVKALLHRHPLWSKVPTALWFDLGLASYLLEPEERDYGWPRLSARWATSMGLSPACPGLLALSMAEALGKRLSGAHLLDLMQHLEIPLIPVLASMERAGIVLNASALSDFLEEVQRELENLTETIYREAGGPFNIRSAQQLGDVLFHRLGLPTAGKTRGGQASTSQDVLEKLSGRHLIIDALLEYRKLEKMRSTYLEPLPRLMGKDGRIRTQFNQMGTATGRLSSSNPNLQNIPVRGKMGQRMRACFTAPTGKLLISADYSQIELRVLAHLSQDGTLLTAFREGADIHARTASLLYDTAPEQITADQRRNAKTINFGLIYGMGAQKLAQELKISLSEARAFMTRYFERLQGLKKFYENAEAQAVELGYVTTMAGRRRPLPNIRADAGQARALARRQAINTLVQGSAADIIKLAMLAVYADPLLKTLDARLLLQVHDELILEVPEDNASAAGKRVAELMAGVRPGGIEISVPLKSDWGAAKNWSLAH